MLTGLPTAIATTALFLSFSIQHGSCTEVPTHSPQPSIAFYLFSAVVGTIVAKFLWEQRRPLLNMLGKKKLLGGSESKKELEARIELLQKAVRDRDNTIAELKEKNVRQEKKIDDHTRARLVKEKDATILELKERIRKKDDQTIARLAHPDSPVAKAVLDATLQENRDLHLRIEAMLLQIQEERRVAEAYKRELASSESKNAALEKDLQATKADVIKLQRQLNDYSPSPTKLTPLSSPRSLTGTTPPLSSPRNIPTGTSPPLSSPIHESPPSISPSTTPIKIPTPNNTNNNDQNSTESSSELSRSTPPSEDLNHHPDSIPIDQQEEEQNDTEHNGVLSSDSSISEGNITALSSPRDDLAAELGAYDDLSKLAKDLDTNALAGGESLSDLMDSLDSMASPVQALDFVSLAHDKQIDEMSQALISPTARVERHAPFQSDSAYDQDFMSMFSPPANNAYNNVKVKVRHHSPALNNLFYTEDTSPPPTFDLEGINGDFLANNHDALPQSPTSQEAPTSPWGKIPSPAHSPTSPPPAVFAAQRSASTSPQHDVEPRSKGTHKSIFSVFGNDEMSLPDVTPGQDVSEPAPAQAHDELLLSFGSKVDTNKAGLRRAKKVNLAGFSTKGKAKVEPTMEDVHFCIYPYNKSKSKGLFGVFDGHAGRAAADEASALFPKEFSSQLESNSHDVSQAFLKTYARVDEEMIEHEYMGTTATVVYLWQKAGHKFLQASNVGDSTAFLCRNGVSVRLTVDHKPSTAEEKERMRLSGLEVSESQTRINGLAVSRSLGNHFVKEQNIGMIATPYIGECIEILPTDTHMIVASDGLWDVVNSQHAMDIIRGLDALPAASLLLSTALASSKCNDNVSIIVVRLN